jgi:hypothetical protein
MDRRDTRQSSVIRRPLSVLLSLSLLCCCATQTWAAGTSPSRSAGSRHASTSVQAVASLPTGAPGVAPGVAAPQTMQTKATGEPPHSSGFALANLMTRARGQEGVSPTDPNQDNSLAQELWSSRIAAPSANDDATASLALKRLIRQVHSLTANDSKPVQLSIPVREPEPALEPSAPLPTSTESVEPALESSVLAAAETTTGLPPKAQKTLGDLRKNPSRVRDPLETAELLFLSGRPTDAVPFYEEALRHTRAGDAAAGGDRAWILFQLGNCLRETDTAKAQDSYMKLIAEYPNSPWTEMARAGGRFLTWYQSTRPDQLMATRKP